MINIIKPQFLKWNSDNSEEHFDLSKDPNSWKNGAETYFSIFNYELFCMCTYSRVKKDYLLDAEGVRIIKQEQKSEDMPVFDEDDDMNEQHEIEIEWAITEPKGHVFITVDGERVGIEWADGKIKDIQGNEAHLRGMSDHYRVEEILTPDQHDTLVEIKRPAKLRNMSTGKMREMLNFRMMELAR